MQIRKSGRLPLLSSMSLSFPLLLWFPGLNTYMVAVLAAGWARDQLTWQELIERLLRVE